MTRQSLIARWQKDWARSSAFLKALCPTVKHNFTYPNSRKDCSIVTRLRLGVTNLTHSYLLSKDDPPICSVCNEDLTVSHILLYCIEYENARKSFALPPTLKDIFCKQKTVNSLVKFINEIGLDAKI